MVISKVNEPSWFTDKNLGGGQNTEPQSMDYPKQTTPLQMFSD